MRKLRDAIKDNQLEMVKKLLAERANINRRDKDGNTLLFYAKSGEMVRLLVEHGASVNIHSSDGYLPLHVAESVEVAEALVSAGADINALDREGLTPLLFGMTNGVAPEVSIYLVRAGTNLSLLEHPHYRAPLFYSTTRDLAQALIQFGADINQRDELGKTPLHSPDIDSSTALLLIESGADVNAIDNRGETPLFGTRMHDAEQIITVLLENGADPSIENCDGHTAFEELFSSGLWEDADFLQSLYEKRLLEKLLPDPRPHPGASAPRL